MRVYLSNGMGVESVTIITRTKHGLRYVYRERKRSTYPAREEFYTVAPAHVETKAKYGIPWFDQRWEAPLFERNLH